VDRGGPSWRKARGKSQGGRLLAGLVRRGKHFKTGERSGRTKWASGGTAGSRERKRGGYTVFDSEEKNPTRTS